MPPDTLSEFEHSVLQTIEQSANGMLPMTPAYQDALKRLLAGRQVFLHADHKGGYVSARSLASLPSFYAHNLEARIAGQVGDEALEPNVSIYDRYVQSLPAALRPAAEARRVAVLGRPVHHRLKPGGAVIHDPLHTVFLVPGAGDHPGWPGNYLTGQVCHTNAEAAEAWRVDVRDSEDGWSAYTSATEADAWTTLQDLLASAPFHLAELEALGFTAR